MHLYKTPEGPLWIYQSNAYLLKGEWDTLINQSKLHQYLNLLSAKAERISEAQRQDLIKKSLAPIGNQEVWAAGVTYLRSRDARMEESKESGAADVYQKVYEADRPELFFKALPARVAGPGDHVFIRSDSTWNVPEPELTLFINSAGEIQAYTIGNDMSSRSIEGENPLYLPQAKIYERSCALGPCLFVPPQPISSETKIAITISRNQEEVFSNSIQLNRMKRSLPELASWLYKFCKFPVGCFLMTGTGIVPPNNFTLQKKDEVSISIEGIGMLKNTVDVL
ncbi:MAG TPA: fumarylacetoacetate hydrolase family protein [Cyclobacteriaceae bacterium]|nr:fumarylacetoacetate hydrolase family protein [Cyclobacteriaceae bacterium]